MVEPPPEDLSRRMRVLTAVRPRARKSMPECCSNRASSVAMRASMTCCEISDDAVVDQQQDEEYDEAEAEE